MALSNGSGEATSIASTATAATQSAITTAGIPKNLIHCLVALITFFICRFIVVYLHIENKERDLPGPR